MEILFTLAIIAGGLFALALIPMLFRRIVPADEVHVLLTSKKATPFGQQTTNGNAYYKWPSWIPVIGVEVKALQISIFDIELDAYEAYDKGRLQFLVDVTAFFRISDYAMAAQRVSSNEHLRQQLTSIVQGAVRSILAKSEIEDIMEERSILGEQFTSEVKEQLKSWGIEAVKNIELMDIKDAPKSEIISNIMAKKRSHIEMESRLEVAKNMKLAQIAEVEAKREIDLGKQEAAQTVGLRTAEAEREVELAKERKKQALVEQSKITTEKELQVQQYKLTREADIQKEVALIDASRSKEVSLVKVNEHKEVAIVNSNKEKEIALIEAEKLKSVALLNAEKEKEAGAIFAEAQYTIKTKEAEAEYMVKTRTAEADLISMQNSAKGIEVEGLARAAAEEALLLAPVNSQIKLAKEIGENKEYQDYLLQVERIKAEQAVGTAQAEALSTADLKIIANAGSAQEGIESIGQLFTSNGGTKIGALLEGLKNTPAGKDLLNKVGIQ